MPFSHMVIFVDICLIFHLKSEILSEYLCPSDLLRNISGIYSYPCHLRDRINGLKQKRVRIK